MKLDNFNADLTKAYCKKCNTFFFTHYKNRIENKMCAVCENIDNFKINWENLN